MTRARWRSRSNLLIRFLFTSTCHITLSAIVSSLHTAGVFPFPLSLATPCPSIRSTCNSFLSFLLAYKPVASVARLYSALLKTLLRSRARVHRTSYLTVSSSFSSLLLDKAMLNHSVLLLTGSCSDSDTTLSTTAVNCSPPLSYLWWAMREIMSQNSKGIKTPIPPFFYWK